MNLSNNLQVVNNSQFVESHESPLLPAWVRRRLDLLNIQLPSYFFSAGISIAFVLLFNKSFFGAAWNTQPLDSLSAVVFLLSLAPLLWLLTFLFINALCIPYLAKPLAILLLVGGSFAAYFMDAYGLTIDKEMLRNAWETDIDEVEGLVNFHLIGYVIFLGVLPSILVAKARIRWGGFWHEVRWRIIPGAITLIISVIVILSLSDYYSSFFRNHKNVRFLANPLGFVNAAIGLANESLQRPLVMDAISRDAHLGAGTTQQTKPLLVVFVVGETARAANFGINGYERNTTPMLAQKDIVNFSHFSSCGTSTAVSVPCMFSELPRADYSARKAKSQHGLLDFISVAGVDVLWRDNNSGCKGVCDRVPYESSNELLSADLCKDGECFDEALLDNLSSKLTGRNEFIVLHQKGSHGPAYDQRYPDSMRVFQPVCSSNRLQDCSREEVINAYDNSIHYTDYFLGRVIDWLTAQQAAYNTVMVYVSDHGESLGENNIYLHGMPYAFAPDNQKQVPFIFWASSSFYRDRALNKECLMKLKDREFTQDNIFHSFLGLLDIKTKYYQPKLDIYASCIERS
ncbi:phosphoethanolamine--lipid A transferase [Cellvibrio sp. NN19]|uniref:phosphoethanolamine transferase n=1 Tax=Cellvibrio chitinivorans TaxID=3102792 RepID=UPI002B4016AF|nr:phosphoethanolamine--lipid A transferase [Cellvibrio sp. NN19]